MTTGTRDATYYTERLYRLLPNVYRARDERGELQQFLALFGAEFARLRGNIDQLWRDFYIDSCQEWVIPYIADLVSTNLLSNQAARNRNDVRHTIGWRRRKGTLACAEDVAAEIGDAGTLAVEMFERLIWNQNLNHLRPRAWQTAALAAPSRMGRTATPFELDCRTLDLRAPTARTGRHLPSRVSVFEWLLAANPWRGVNPQPAGGGRWRFHPLGIDQPLYAGGDRGAVCDAPNTDPTTRADICHGHADRVPIRGRDFHDNPGTYFGGPVGFTLYEDGIALCAAEAPASTQSILPSVDFTEFAATDGLLVADASVFSGTQQFEIAAPRLGALLHLVEGVDVPTDYSPAQAFAAQLVVRAARGTLAIDAGAATYVYTKGSTPYLPDSVEWHGPELLLRLTSPVAPEAFPESEIVIAGSQGRRLQVFLPAIAALAPGQEFYLYVAEDGATYYARGDHGAGPPDRNPDSSVFGAYLGRHLARAAEGQVRIRPGRPPVNRYRVPVYRPLCCWDQPFDPPLAAHEVAFDPQRGRFRFPDDPATHPAGKLTADFRFGFTGAVGAGPYFREPLLADSAIGLRITVAQAADADHASVQAALNAVPDGMSTAVVIEILDSRTYEEELSLNGRNFPGGLVLRAADLETPVIRKPNAAASLWRIQNSDISELTLDGLLLSGGTVQITEAIAALRLRQCSLDPRSVVLDFGTSVSDARLRILASIAGPVACSANVSEVQLEDSVVHHPDSTVEQPAGHSALVALGAGAVLARSTFIGDVVLDRLNATNALFFGALTLADAPGSCLRYCRLPVGVGDARRFRTTTAVPIFVSLHYGRPGYLHLHPQTAAALRSGGEEGGEIGAFYQTGIPWREQNIGLKLAEYLPAALSAVPVRVLPAHRFSGATLP